MTDTTNQGDTMNATALENEIADMCIREQRHINAHRVFRETGMYYLVNGERVRGFRSVALIVDAPNRDAITRWAYLRISDLRKEIIKTSSEILLSVIEKEIARQYITIEVAQKGWELMSHDEKVEFSNSMTY